MIDTQNISPEMAEEEKSVKSAWENVIIKRIPPRTEVRSMILRSWYRCLARGLDPMSKNAPPALSRKEFEILLEKNKDVIEVSTPVMQVIDMMIKDTGFVASLSDRTGHVLMVMGDEEILEMAIRNYYLPGCVRTLDEAGTNAIGLCLLEGRPMQLTGAEHFNVNHHPWTCSSAPFHDFKGNILGVITLSGKYYGRHQHTLGLVTAAAETIEAQLRIRHVVNEKERLNSMLTSIYNSIPDGVIAVDKEMVVTHMNKSAAGLLAVDDETVVGFSLAESLRPNQTILEALKNQEYFSGVELTFGEQDQRRTFIGRIDPIFNAKGQDSGAVIVLSKKQDVINMAKRIGGNYARYRFGDIKGRTPSLLKQIEMAKMAAKTDSRMLIAGESGTGKELFAQAIHNHSRRSKEPFVAISCAAIPRDLIESELFGYRGGAFTGARREGMVGKFELAHKGTLFLDEINGLPLDMQTKLLRVLQQSEIMRLGDTKPIPVDVRVLAATNTDLLAEVENSNFRKDLFFRLSTMEIFIPPLRERLVDLELLVEHIMERQSLKMGTRKPRISAETMGILQTYDWPGNVRELENTIERAVLLCQGDEITPDLLPDRLYSSTQVHQPTSLHDSYRQIIEKALSRSGGNISAAARDLNIARSTLYRKMREFGLPL